MLKKFTALRKKLKLRTQLILFLLVQIGVILGMAGFYVDWQVRRAVEDELGQKLLAIGKVAAEQAKDTRAFMLLPGEEDSRTIARLHDKFKPLLESGTIARIILLDAIRLTYYDSQKQVRIGEEYIRARLDELEFDRALSGQATTSKFFFDNDGNPFKAVYVPVEIDGVPASGIICLEGSAAGLQAIDVTRNVLLTIGLIAIVVAVISGGVIARQVTRPLEKLKDAAAAVTYGKFDVPLERTGSSEIVFLAQTIDEMRIAIDQKQQRQQMMLAGVAHEVRNPLGGIQLFASMLQKTAGEKQRPQIEKILKEANHLNKIITDFLSYARPVQANPGEVNLNAIIQETQALTDNGVSNIDWRLSVAKDLVVKCDADHLRQIFTNLFQNAFLAVREVDEPEIHVTARIKNGFARIRILDNGPGIAKDNSEKIFEPFFTTRNEGTGLGLALVKLLIEENSGKIALEKSKTGANFCIWIPKI